MKILITGSAGFIGSCLSTHFHNLGHRVLGLDKVRSSNCPYSTVCVDMRSYDELYNVVLNFMPDVVINLAARTDLNSSKLISYSDNTLSVENLCRASSIFTLPASNCVLYISRQCLYTHTVINLIAYLIRELLTD